jgi:hypothetical protein
VRSCANRDSWPRWRKLRAINLGRTAQSACFGLGCGLRPVDRRGRCSLRWRPVEGWRISHWLRRSNPPGKIGWRCCPLNDLTAGRLRVPLQLHRRNQPGTRGPIRRRCGSSWNNGPVDRGRTSWLHRWDSALAARETGRVKRLSFARRDRELHGVSFVAERKLRRGSRARPIDGRPTALGGGESVCEWPESSAWATVWWSRRVHEKYLNCAVKYNCSLERVNASVLHLYLPLANW